MSRTPARVVAETGSEAAPVRPLAPIARTRQLRVCEGASPSSRQVTAAPAVRGTRTRQLAPPSSECSTRYAAMPPPCTRGAVQESRTARAPVACATRPVGSEGVVSSRRATGTVPPACQPCAETRLSSKVTRNPPPSVEAPARSSSTWSPPSRKIRPGRSPAGIAVSSATRPSSAMAATEYRVPR